MAHERRVGTVRELWRYPVKSMAGERVADAELGWQGLDGDRRWAFLRPGSTDSTFPWLTIRDRSDMVRYAPRLTDPEEPNRSATTVLTPAGDELDVTDPALAAELGAGVALLRQGRGSFDSLPLSLLTTRSLEGLRDLAERDVDVRQLRPNLLVEPSTDDAFPEDAWVGATLRIGEARMRIDRRDPRCVVVNVDPVNAERDPRVLRAIAQQRDACLGVYGSTVTPGRVAVGDAVLLEA